MKFFGWAKTSGGKMATELDYVAMPDNAQNLVREFWKADIKDTNGKSIWK